MIVTEAEAKTKWCPHAMSVREASGRPEDEERYIASNRLYDGRSDPGARCLGSECMAWVWKRFDGGLAVEVSPNRRHQQPEGEGWVWLSPRSAWVRGAPEKRLGGCGLNNRSD